MDNKDNILDSDFHFVQMSQELWLEQREKKRRVYQALSEYIEFLETVFMKETNLYKKSLLGKEIRKLNKQLKKYDVSSILEIANYHSIEKHKENDSILEKSSFSFSRRKKKRNEIR